MSRVRTWEKRKNWNVLASTAAAVAPPRTPDRRLPAQKTSPTVRRPASAGHSRAVHSSAPSTWYETAVSQYCSGGFSKYLRPFNRGVTQSPEVTISCGICAYRPSSGWNSSRYSSAPNHTTRTLQASRHTRRTLVTDRVATGRGRLTVGVESPWCEEASPVSITLLPDPRH